MRAEIEKLDEAKGQELGYRERENFDAILRIVKSTRQIFESQRRKSKSKKVKKSQNRQILEATSEKVITTIDKAHQGATFGRVTFSIGLI
jgi:hypothetical protein